MADLAYREARAEDLPFIERAFLSSYRTSFSAGLITMPRWDQVMGEEWRRILARPDCRAWVAYHPGEEIGDRDLYGYIVTLEGYRDHKTKKPLPYVVFSYIKEAYRWNYGIEEGLFESAGISPNEPFHYAAKTPHLGRLYGPRATWKPLAARFAPHGFTLKI